MLNLRQKSFSLKSFKDDSLVDKMLSISEFDFFICGSDQIWNRNCADFSNVYLLDFVANKNKCISYSPSFGNFDLNLKTFNDFYYIF